jgi:hypothetical protein
MWAKIVMTVTASRIAVLIAPMATTAFWQRSGEVFERGFRSTPRGAGA